MIVIVIADVLSKLNCFVWTKVKTRVGKRLKSGTVQFWFRRRAVMTQDLLLVQNHPAEILILGGLLDVLGHGLTERVLPDQPHLAALDRRHHLAGAARHDHVLLLVGGRGHGTG